jgi:DNA end-binding protein Ku
VSASFWKEQAVARSIWSGAISFGLVNVPIKVYSAVSRKTVHFNQLHDADGARIQQRRVCSADGEEVPYEHIVKGYEVTPGQYVVISNEELEALEASKTKTIEIDQFVDPAEIDPILYDQPYYLLLTMETLVYADEVVPADSLDEAGAAEIEVSEKELGVARQLIEMLSAPFDADRFRDEYRDAVLALIERKVAGEEIEIAPAAAPPAAVPDLMAALQASIAAVGRAGERLAVDGGEAPPAKPKRRSSSTSGARAPRKAPARKS